jgi:hypothetical protein
MGECEAEVEQENGSETEERREEDEAGELVEVGRVMRAMERRVVRRREDEQERYGFDLVDVVDDGCCCC